jgi:adenylate kinase
MKVDRVVYLVVPDEEIVERLSGRLICKECQVPFHKTYNPFKTCPTGKCHGEFLYQRDDDKPETVRARLETFHNQTSPLVSYYKNTGVLVEVPGNGEIEQVKQSIIAAVK